MSSNLSIVILAAGKGSRMKSDMAKVLHPISGKPMLFHIIKASKEISDDISVVVAHQKERVIESMKNYFDDVVFIVINFDKHILIIRQLLDRLEHAGLRVDMM